MRRKQQTLISLILAGALCAGNISSAVYAGETGVLETTSLSPEETLVGVESGESLPVIPDTAATRMDSSESAVSKNPLLAPEEEETTNVESLDAAMYDVWNNEGVPGVEMTEETEDSFVMEDLMFDEDSDEEENTYDNFMEEELSAAEDSGNAEIVKEGVCGTYVKWKLDAEGHLTIYSESDTPQPMSDYSDSESPFYAFGNKIEAITVGPNVSRIGANAFRGCGNFTSIELQGSVAEIDESACIVSDSLTDVFVSEDNDHFTFLDGVLYNSEMTRLIFCLGNQESVLIPDSVMKIGGGAFSGCHKITNITIPETVQDIGSNAFRNSGIENINIPYGVTVINSGVFGCCKNLKSIVLPDSVQEIGNSAFMNSGIENIIVPDEVTTINNNVFEGCKSLKTISLPARIQKIGSGAFKDSGIENINIPDGVTVINSSVFEGCKSLKTTTLPDNVQEIRDGAFKDSGIENIIIPDGVTIINSSVFEGCKSLKTITLPDNVQEIGSGAFRNSGIENIYIPNGVTAISDWAFENCKNLKNIILPEGVNVLGYRAFGHCEELEGICIPQNVKIIESYLFADCYNLNKVRIPDGVTQIRGYAFNNCYSLKKIYIPESVWTMDFSSLKDLVLYGEKGSYAESYAMDNSLTFGSVYYHGIVALDDYTGLWIDEDTGRLWKHESEGDAWYFSDSSSNEWIPAASVTGTDSDYEVILLPYLEDVSELFIAEVVPNTDSGEEAEETPYSCGPNVTWELNEQGVLTIDGTGEMYNYPDGSYENPKKSPFYGSELIKEVRIGEQVTSIGAYLFQECKNLESISIPDTVSIIGEGAFDNCDSLEVITVPASVNVIRDNTFNGCDSLREVNYLGEVSHIGYCAFYLCTGLEIGPEFNGVKTIEQQAFGHCSGLKRITIPKSVSSMASDAFWGCYRLESFNVDPDNMHYRSSDGVLYDKTGENLLQCPPSLSYVSVLSETKNISDYAFEGCNIKKVIFTGNLETIGLSAFSECHSLESIILPDSVVSIESGAFLSCISLKEVKLPGNITDISVQMFRNCQSLTQIDIPSSVINIQDYAFGGCDNLKTVSFPSSLINIGEYAFKECRNLSGITMPKGIKTIGEGAFDGCWNLGEIWLPDSLENIGNNAFRDCYDIKIIRYNDQDFSESSPEYEERFNIDIHNDENGSLIDDQGNEYYYDEENTELYRLNKSGGKTPVREYYRQQLVVEGFTANEINDFFAADIIEYHRAVEDSDEDILSAAAISDLSVRSKYAFFVRKKRYLSAIANKQKRAQTALNKSTKTSSSPTVKISYRGTIYMTAGRKLRAPRVYGLKRGDSVSKWTSSKKTVVRVNSKTGLLTAKRKGTAAITVYTRYGARARFIVKVTKPTVGLSKKKVTLNVGGSTIVSVRMVSGDKISSVRSSKKKVVRVVRLGQSIYLIAGKKGKAKITVRTKFGGKKTMKVVVKEK